MKRIGNYIYRFSETSEWVCCGKIIMGVDGEFIQYFE